MDDTSTARIGEQETSRYLVVSRRAMLAGLALAAGGGWVAGCSDGDQRVFATDAGASTTEAQTAPEGQTGNQAENQGGNQAGAVPDSAALQIGFTFAAAGGGGRGPARNPYIAVWIETPAEELVTTIALWHRQREERWLGELKRWYAVADGQGESVSSATRVPGEYTLEWDCTDASGTRVAAGEYVVCIEAAREHGPYELIRESVTLGATAADQTFEPVGELTAASVTYTV